VLGHGGLARCVWLHALDWCCRRAGRPPNYPLISFAAVQLSVCKRSFVLVSALPLDIRCVLYCAACSVARLAVCALSRTRERRLQIPPLIAGVSPPAPPLFYPPFNAQAYVLPVLNALRRTGRQGGNHRGGAAADDTMRTHVRPRGGGGLLRHARPRRCPGGQAANTAAEAPSHGGRAAGALSSYRLYVAG